MGTVLMPELSRAVQSDDRQRDRACRIARPGTRGRPRAARDAGPDRAERADRAAAVRAWRVHGHRYALPRRRRWSGSRSACPRMCWSRRCRRRSLRARIRSTPLLATLKGLAVAIVLARRCSAICSAPAASPPPSRSAPGAARSRLIRARRCDLRLFDRCRCAPAAAAHRCWPRSRWAACSGWRRLRAADRRHAHGSRRRSSLLVADRRRQSRFMACFWRCSASPAGARRLTRSAQNRPPR